MGYDNGLLQNPYPTQLKPLRYFHDYLHENSNTWSFHTDIRFSIIHAFNLSTDCTRESHTRINNADHSEQNVQYTDVKTSFRTLLTKACPSFKTNMPNVLNHMSRHSATHLILAKLLPARTNKLPLWKILVKTILEQSFISLLELHQSKSNSGSKWLMTNVKTFVKPFDKA